MTRRPTSTREHDMSAHTFDTAGSTTARSCPCSAPPQVMFVRGRGTELWDTDGKRYLDFLCGLAVVVARPRQPGDRRGDLPSRRSTLLHVSNFFANPQATAAAVEGRTSCCSRPPGTPARSSSPTPAPRPTSARSSWPASSAAAVATRGQRARQLPRPHAGDARRHRPAGQARAVPADARGLPPRRVGRPRRAARPPSTARSPRC